MNKSNYLSGLEMMDVLLIADMFFNEMGSSSTTSIKVYIFQWVRGLTHACFSLSLQSHAPDPQNGTQPLHEGTVIYYVTCLSVVSQTLTRCIAFHSYKGGTGKTTLAANLAALLAKNGHRVFLLDLDVHAPSLQSYFEADPKKWINDFLFEDAELNEVVLDFTPLIDELLHNNRSSNQIKDKKRGQLWVGFSSRKKEEIYKMDGWSPATGKQSTSKMQLFRRFILLTELLNSEYQADYIIIDTSPGIRYWALNALTVADTILLTLKMGDLDVDGTTALVAEIYGSFTKFGTKSFLLWNRVAGYCIPHNGTDVNTRTSSLQTEASENLVPPAIHESSLLMEQQQSTKTKMKDFLTSKTEMKVIASIPCYCVDFLPSINFCTPAGITSESPPAKKHMLGG
jgi:chromosome partitioning protein